jgi:hypothetical protein
MLSLLAGDVSRSTDQPAGRVHGQVKLATMSSNVSPEEKAISKTYPTSGILVLSKTYPTSGIYLADA